MESLTAADPRTVGEFRLRARLGSGGMGQVFLASSPAGRIVAVKVIHAELAREPEFIRRFRSEVNAAQRVSGLYTAPVVAAGVDDTPPWLATAFVPGPSLDDIVGRYGPLPVPALWRLAGGLAEALRAIHATELIHRDGGVAGWVITSRPSVSAPTLSQGGASQPGASQPGASPPAGGGRPQATDQGPGSKAWSFATGSEVLASPAVANGVVYVGSKDNYVYALSAATGRQAWKRQVGWVLLAPRIVGEMVCLTTDTGEFSAIRASSGAVVWQVQTGVPAAFARPWAVSGGNVILCSTSGPLQAYDVATGGQGRTYGSADQFYRAVGAAGGVIYAMDESGTLHAFSAGTGALLWNTAVVTDGDIPSTSVVAAGGDIYVGTTGGTLYSVDATTGHLNWNYATGNELESDPVVARGTVYVTDTSGTLHAVTAEGKAAWQHPSAPGFAGPAVAGGRVYVSTGTALQALDARSGDAGWSYSPPDSGAFVSTPAVADGLVFVGCTDDSLYALRA